MARALKDVLALCEDEGIEIVDFKMTDIDGIKNKIDPHAKGWGPFDFNLFDLPA